MSLRSTALSFLRSVIFPPADATPAPSMSHLERDAAEALIVAERAATARESAAAEHHDAKARFDALDGTDAGAFSAARDESDRTRRVYDLRIAEAERLHQVAVDLAGKVEAAREAARLAEQRALGAVDRLDRCIASDIEQEIEHEKANAARRARLQDRLDRANAHRVNAGMPAINPGRIDAHIVIARAAGNICEQTALEVRAALGAYNYPGLRIPIDPAEYVRRVMALDCADPCRVLDNEIAVATRQPLTAHEQELAAKRAAEVAEHNESFDRAKREQEARERGELVSGPAYKVHSEAETRPSPIPRLEEMTTQEGLRGAVRDGYVRSASGKILLTRNGDTRQDAADLSAWEG